MTLHSGIHIFPSFLFPIHHDLWLQSLCNPIRIISTTTNHVYCNCLFHFNFKFYMKLTLKQPVVFMFEPQKLSFGWLWLDLFQCLLRFHPEAQRHRAGQLCCVQQSHLPWDHGVPSSESDPKKILNKENNPKFLKIICQWITAVLSLYMVRWGGVERS